MSHFWKCIICAYAIFIQFATATTIHTISVDNPHDTASNTLNCQGSTPGSCNLRSAWSLCGQYGTACVISLTPHMAVLMNTSLGHLTLQKKFNITIQGHGSSISADKNTIKSWSSRRFITYQHQLNITTPSNGPVLIIQNATIKEFGHKDLTNGGALSLNGDCDLLLTDVEFMDNSAKNGGALYITNNTLRPRLQGCRFDSNVAYGAGPSSGGGSSYAIVVEYSGGGAVYVDQRVPDMLISDCSFTNCYSYGSGGALYLGTGIDRLVVSRSSFYQCTADGSGGAIYSVTNWQLLIVTSNFSDCKSKALLHTLDGGGALNLYQNNANAAVTGCLFAKCSVDGYGYGGAVMLYSNNSNFKLSHSTIEECYADYGGAVMLYSINYYFELSETTVYGSNRGGVVVNLRKNNSFFSLSNSIILCGGEFGKAISLDKYNDYVSLSNVTIEDCFAGAISLDEMNNYFSVMHSTMFNCSTTTVGGAVFLSSNNKYFSLLNSTIKKCSVLGGWQNFGGGVYLGDNNNYAIVSDSRFKFCSASSGGGAMFISTNDVLIINSTFEHCSSTNVKLQTSGGAVHIHSVRFFIADGNSISNVHFVGCSFYNNFAYYGGAINSVETSNLVIAGSTFIGNTAVGLGGAINTVSPHYQMAITDLQGYNTYEVIETDHPIGLSYANYDPEFRYTMNVPGAAYFILIFDVLTEVTRACDIYDADGTNTFSSRTEFPGINKPALKLLGSSFTLVASSMSATSWGVRLYAYPVFASPSRPCLFQANTAYSGGAVYFYDGNNFAVVINTQFSRNTAVWEGGGINLRLNNIGVSFTQVSFTENESANDAGAVSISMAQYGVVFLLCYFEANNATNGNGGAAFVDMSNGVGLFVTGNEISFSDCVFIKNTASNGAALYLGKSNNVTLINSNCYDNVAFKAGGAIYLNSFNRMSMNSVTLQRNLAVNGGAMFSYELSQLFFTKIVVESNTASSSGGALFINNNSVITFSDSSSLMYNEAGQAGGAIVSIACPLWTMRPGAYITYAGNVAPRGSALFFKSLVSVTDQELSDSGFSGNTASTGGTVFWIYDADMTAEPAGLLNTSLTWSGNSAPYGVIAATQATSMRTAMQYIDVTLYYKPLPTIYIYLYDNYTQRLHIHGTTTVTVKITAANCAGRYYYLSGSDSLYQAVEFTDGVAAFDQLTGFCNPGGNLTLLYTAQLGDLAGISATVAQPYYLSTSMVYRFRNCEAGEFLSEGQCQICPRGTYSLHYEGEGTVCSVCVDTVGISACEGDNITLSSGYWRRFPHNTAVLACPLIDGCVSGDGTGDALCAAGYEGPLCAVCSDGYFSSDSQCAECQGANIFSPKIIIILLVLIVAFVSLTIYYRKEALTLIEKVGAQEERWANKEDQEDQRTRATSSQQESDTEKASPSLLLKIIFQLKLRYSQITSKSKIIIATMQIIMAAPATFTLSFPTSFMSFLNIFKILDFSFNVLPLACMQHVDFIDTLVMVTSFPICLTVALLAMYTLHYSYRTVQLDKSNKNEGIASTSAEFKTIERHLKAKYLYLFLMLSYLVLPSTTTTIFQTFVCQDIDPSNEDGGMESLYLVADYSIACSGAHYNFGLAWAVCMIFVYPIGIPGFYFYKLWRVRQEISQLREEGHGESVSIENAQVQVDDNAAMVVKTDNNQEAVTSDDTPLSDKANVLLVLFDSYRPRYWYFEVIECTRRLFLTAVLSVVDTGSSAQVVLGMMVSFGYICLYAYCQPYKEMQNSVLASVGQTQIYFTFFGALIISNDLLGGGWNLAVGALLVVLNTGVLVISFKGELDTYWASRDEEAALQRGMAGEWGTGISSKGGDGESVNPLQTVEVYSAKDGAKAVELISMDKTQRPAAASSLSTESNDIDWKEEKRFLEAKLEAQAQEIKAQAQEINALKN